ncbi:Zinc finger, C3HC4 type (RING finger) domain-containing protein [Spironucleus salmonicida]|uniref:Zinc finger, C3HC4 type (RING finger) domain-containing protein n=1 Tax=Spironucleus salmonicida TaxID=348837 RepID=V6LH57_9EUKA|nr:Zinc finger, C3HC4 type (RING finger) domain-containing protein [Spironucleus salmonicida]|eukprot:EST43890.1 Zinc finger, C3HC4 type (RING finger) domain-containing protein [Spironucleus salmonicida]
MNEIKQFINQEVKIQGQCPMCFSKLRKIFIINCGHLYCEQCIKSIKQCVVCKEKISSKQQIFGIEYQENELQKTQLNLRDKRQKIMQAELDKVTKDLTSLQEVQNTYNFHYQGLINSELQAQEELDKLQNNYDQVYQSTVFAKDRICILKELSKQIELQQKKINLL